MLLFEAARFKKDNRFYLNLKARPLAINVTLQIIWRTFLQAIWRSRRLAQTTDFATSRHADHLPAFLRCKNVLHKHFDWRHLCTTLIGYAK